VLQFSDNTQLFVPKGYKWSARPEVLAVVVVEDASFWYMMLLSWASSSQYSKRAQCFHLQNQAIPEE
jgi:hypothetical protein